MWVAQGLAGLPGTGLRFRAQGLGFSMIRPESLHFVIAIETIPTIPITLLRITTLCLSKGSVASPAR